jgi:hypothetical protein
MIKHAGRQIFLKYEEKGLQIPEFSISIYLLNYMVCKKCLRKDLYKRC